MKERKKPKYDMEPRYVLLIMTMVCIFLIFFSYRFSDLFGSIRTRLNSMIIPMQKGITTIGNGINNTIDRFEEVEKLQKEIEELIRILEAYDMTDTPYDWNSEDPEADIDRISELIIKESPIVIEKGFVSDTAECADAIRKASELLKPRRSE